MNTTNLKNSDIAIIGLAGYFASEGISAAQLYRSLANNKELYQRQTERDQGSYVSLNASVKHVKMFDAEFFGYSTTPAKYLDPQQRLLLECSWNALEDACIDPEQHQGTIGLFAGCELGEYAKSHILPQQLTNLGDLQQRQQKYACLPEYLATTVGYKLNLTGPCLTIGSACSSSLSSVSMAQLSLLSHQCDTALAGGVSVKLLDEKSEGYHYQQGGILSPTGSCQPFTEQADGTFFSDGAGVVVLKRLADAIKDNDHIYAVIHGVGVNNDGSEKAGYTAPSINGQAKCILSALKNANANPKQLKYIETHGTATKIGDQIELAALEKVFEQFSGNYKCAIGSLKQHTGHMDAASGIAGLIKIALSFKHGTIPEQQPAPSKPCKQLNQTNSHLYLAQENISLKKGDLVGLSSFGIGGTNTHIIIGAPPIQASSQCEQTQQLIPLSAKSALSLNHRIRGLATFIDHHPETKLQDVAHTLQTGRSHMTHRCFIIASSTEELQQKLNSGELTKNLVKHRPQSNQTIANNDLTEIGEHWLFGEKINWAALTQKRGGKKIPLPGYRFDRKLYWLEKPQNNQKLTNNEQHNLIEIKNKLRKIFVTLLGDISFSDDDRFFDLGGESFLFALLLDEISTAFKLDLDFDVIHDIPTINQLAEYINTTEKTTPVTT